jgi:hypothetical protein
MEKYKHLYVWMLIPLVVSQVGIFSYYWPKFSSVTWEIHIHYWLISIWYLLVVVQPYLISKNLISNHRTLGIFGFVIAGGVIFSGITILDLPLKYASNFTSANQGPPLAFYYGTLVIEFVLMMAFVFAIAQSILKRHQTAEHAYWLICSVFYLIAPGLGRGMIVLWSKLLPPEKFTPLFPLLSTEVIYLIMFVFFAHKFGRLKHLATYIGLSLVLVRLLRFPIGNSIYIQEFLNNVIKW